VELPVLDEEEGREWRGMGALNSPKMMGHHKPTPEGGKTAYPQGDIFLLVFFFFIYHHN
jgi:hypothetical protein